MRFAFLCLLPALACASYAGAVITPDAAVMKLDEVAIYAVGYAYRGGEEHLFPVGWQGHFEEHTGVSCKPVGEYAGKTAFLLHCPWRNGTGVAFQDFDIHLPALKKVTLKGWTAMAAEYTDRSDGATFRVYTNGRRLLDVHRTDAVWKPFDLDLSPYAGKTVHLRFETDPGPKDDPSFDYSYWGDRELVLDGFKPSRSVHHDPPPLDLSRVLSSRTDGVVPRCGFSGTGTVTVNDGRAVLRYSGRDGELTYTWEPPMSENAPFLGALTLTGRGGSGDSVNVPLAGNAGAEWIAPAVLEDTKLEKTPDGAGLVREFRVGDQTVTLRTTASMVGKSLVFDVTSDRPCVKIINFGDWGPVLRKKPVPTPYYSGQPYYLPSDNLFVNSFLDWTFSNASSQNGVTAHYGAGTDGSYRPVRERAVYSAAWHLDEVFPNIPNPPSPYLKQLGGRIVLDIWGGRYTDIAAKFEKLADYGIDDCAAIIHNWQRSGYDNALPSHIPAAANLGGDEGMKTLVATGKRLGYYVSLHENYVDYYPNYDHFDENDIALNPDGKRVLAWYNPGTKIQSFAVKPNAVLRLAKTQSPEIHKRYGTNADYLDVHSAVPPWFHVDFRAGEEGSAMFERTWDVHRQLWQYERRTHGGPVFGEGCNHWYWSGCLDGVEAQFGAGWPANKGLEAPLMVDFDLLKVHPLQFNHGMGYYERWRSGWGGVPPMVQLDQYRMQEVAYGHAGFLGASAWSVIPAAWLEHHLMAPVTARYSDAKPSQIRYHVGGKWVDSTAAAKAADWRRVQVTYDNGLTVTANSADSPLNVDGYVLPRFGWLAKGAGVTAYTAVRDGVLVDYAETSDSVFANARNAADWTSAFLDIRRVQPSVAQFEQIAPRKFRVTYRWKVDDTLREDYNCFVHFAQPKTGNSPEDIQFQQDHTPPSPTSAWRPGTVVTDGPYTVEIPENLADGDYMWMTGLFSKDDGRRVNLLGVDDGHQRIRLGVLRISDGGKTIEFIPEKSSGLEKLKLYEADLNKSGKTVDFGSIRTNGSVLAKREGDEWTLRALPRDKSFAVELNSGRFGIPQVVQSLGAKEKTVRPEVEDGWWRLRLNGAKVYRWRAG